MKHIRLAAYMRQYAVKSRKNDTYKRAIRNHARKIEEFENHVGCPLRVADFDERMFEEYDYFLRNDSRNYLRSTITSFGNKAKEFITKAKREGYVVNRSYKNYRFPLPEVITVALTESEVLRIYKLKNLSPAQEVARFWFLLSCCTGLRYSDVKRVVEINFAADGAINIRTKKTGTTVVVPAHWMIVSMLKRFDGHLPLLRSQQNFGAVIKRLAKRAKINKPVLVERHEGTRYVRKNKPKWQMISAHTGRRTFATNAYLAGIPLARVMLLTGHKTEAAFFLYIKIDKHENATILSEHEFFRGY